MLASREHDQEQGDHSTRDSQFLRALSTRYRASAWRRTARAPGIAAFRRPKDDAIPGTKGNLQGPKEEPLQGLMAYGI